MSKGRGWIGVDLDGTLARYDGWQGEDHIGEPLQPMIDQVKAWRAQGREVRIFTARASAWGRPTDRLQRNIELIEAWCFKHIGEKLPVTAEKDYYCIEIWDDRAVQVAFNQGEPVYNPEPFKEGGPLFRIKKDQQG